MNQEDLPLVSVIIPVYKVEEYLEESFRSVQRQTYEKLEIILVDDGSPDNCPEMCDAFSREDARVVVIHKPNGGLGSARNAGFSHAHGKYVEFLDSDDWITPEAISFLVHEAEDKSLDVILFGARSFVDGDEAELLAKVEDYRRSQNFDTVMDGVACYRKMISNKEYFTSVCLRFFLSSYFREESFIFQEDIIHEDEDVGFLSVVLADRIEIVDRQFYQRRYRSGSIMTSESQIKSTHGYAGALPSGNAKALYISKIHQLYDAVAYGYLNASRSEKRIIRKKIRHYLRSGLKNRIPLCFNDRIMSLSLVLYSCYIGFLKLIIKMDVLKLRSVLRKRRK